MEDINLIIGKNLSTLRKQEKLTQMELAEKFNYSDKSISKWESGDSMPSIEVLHELAKFYRVTLDYLVTENHNEKLETQTQEKVKIKKPKRYPYQPVVTLLSICAVWVVATALFVCLYLIGDISYPLAFLWAVPASLIVATVFNCFWGHYRYLFPILSALLWTLLVCIHIQLLIVENVWPIYFLGIPLQVAILLWGALVRRPKGYHKQIKEKKIAEKLKQEQTNSSNNQNIQ